MKKFLPLQPIMQRAGIITIFLLTELGAYVPFSMASLFFGSGLWI